MIHKRRCLAIKQDKKVRSLRSRHLLTLTSLHDASLHRCSATKLGKKPRSLRSHQLFEIYFLILKSQGRQPPLVKRPGYGSAIKHPSICSNHLSAHKGISTFSVGTDFLGTSQTIQFHSAFYSKIPTQKDKQLCLYHESNVDELCQDWAGEYLITIPTRFENAAVFQDHLLVRFLLIF